MMWYRVEKTMKKPTINAYLQVVFIPINAPKLLVSGTTVGGCPMSQVKKTKGATSSLGFTRVRFRDAASFIFCLFFLVCNIYALDIDQAWLDQNGPAPYFLTIPGETYVLQENVTVEGTAFIVGAANITLDLNGHEVIYDNSAPTSVPNGGFESGSGSNIPNWEIDYAAAEIVPNTSYLYGNQVLRLPNISGKVTLISDRITIPKANHTYVASITPGNTPDWRTDITLSVIDADSRNVLQTFDYEHQTLVPATGKSDNVERGFSAVAEFTPTTTNDVRLKVEVTPFAGVTTTVDLDYAAVMASFDYGVMASQEWDRQIGGFENFPPRALQVYQSARGFKLTSSAATKGKITQGTGRGFGSAAVQGACNWGGLTIENVETFVWGMNTGSIVSYRAGGVTIRNCIFNQNVDNVANRMSGIAVAGCAAITGNCLIENNKIFGSGQSGFGAGDMEPQYSAVIRNNEIRHESVVTNGYAIAATALSHLKIENNTIISTNGRGILIDGYRSTPTEDIEIAGNYVEVEEKGNREYLGRVSARALRVRNNVDSMGPHRNIHVHDNTFIARTRPGQDEAYGARFSYTNRNGQMDNAGILIENNTFRAITYDPSLNDWNGMPADPAKAFVWDGMQANINPIVRNNVFESNCISLQMPDGDGGGMGDYDTLFISNTMKKVSEGAQVPYRSIVAGWWYFEIHNTKLIDSRFENGATPVISWEGSGYEETKLPADHLYKDLSTGWLLGVSVKAGVTPLPNALVQVSDKYGNTVFSGQTNAQGQIIDIPVSTIFYEQRGNNSKNVSVDDRNPFTIVVIHNVSQLSREITFIGNRTEEFDFGPGHSTDLGGVQLSRNVIHPDIGAQIDVIFGLQTPASVTLKIHGRDGCVKRLADGDYPVGTHILTWDGRNDGGDAVASGIYFLIGTIGDTKIKEKLAVVR